MPRFHSLRTSRRLISVHMRHALVILLTGFLALNLSAAQATEPSTQPAHRYKITYKLANGSEKWDAAAREKLIAAMDEAVALYNANGEFDKIVTANYSPGTPSADGNYSGWLNFGGQINKRVALH